MPIVEEPPRPYDKGKTLVVPEYQSKTTVSPSLPKEVPHLPRATDEDVDSVLRPIQTLFTSLELVKSSSVPCSSFVTRLSTSSILSVDDMNALKKAVLAYTSFIDKDRSKASATSQKELLARLIEDFVDALQHPTIALPADIRLTLREIYQEVSILLSKNSKLKSKKTSLVQAVAENKSLNIAIDKAKSTLNELSSEVVIEYSLLMSLEAGMSDIQA
ncbi:Uncharacterized protein Adt_06859 [Abeliophyllum distichum]|uniref:Uncharacterized protein n=1 Tax=Abeliophyllum distichum TaxID=126358 RepID=A0ABD1VA98_9LAMI